MTEQVKVNPCSFCGENIEILEDIPEDEYVLLCGYCHEKAREGFKGIDLVSDRPQPIYKDLKTIFLGELNWIMSLVQYYHFSVNCVYGRMSQTIDAGIYEHNFLLFHNCRETLENLSSNIEMQVSWLNLTFQKLPDEDRPIFLENLKYVNNLLSKSFERLREMNDINIEFFSNNIVYDQFEYDREEDKPLPVFLEKFKKFKKQEAEKNKRVFIDALLSEVEKEMENLKTLYPPLTTEEELKKRFKQAERSNKDVNSDICQISDKCSGV